MKKQKEREERFKDNFDNFDDIDMEGPSNNNRMPKHIDMKGGI